MSKRMFVSLVLFCLYLCPLLTPKTLGQCIVSGDEIRDFSSRHILEFFVESDSISAEWAREMREAQTVSVFNVSDHIRYEDNVIKAGLVTFSPDSTLEFVNVAAPFWAIVTERLVFQGNNVTIARNLNYLVDQENGADGANGVGYSGRSSNSHGRHGQRGQGGEDGRKGRT